MRVPYPTSFLHDKHVFVLKTMDFDQIGMRKSLFYFIAVR